MSTTFGILIPSTGEMIEIAHRTFDIRWLNSLAHLLPDETEVEPLTNTAQGIYTIGDIKKAMFEKELNKTKIEAECKCEKPILQEYTRQCGLCELYIDRVRHTLLTN